MAAPKIWIVLLCSGGNSVGYFGQLYLTGFWICAGEGAVWKGSFDVLVSGVKTWGRGSNLGTLPSLKDFHPIMYIMTLLEVVVECCKHLRF